ncbi:SRPBCC family protein [Enterovibrio coralii]|uniref:MxaD protein n=1 Tax=Enterovibrio coralii TaxID=294935 RepID=A0A135I2Q9_9GAMM|nr:SRPBCC family protein [Enterovibrio coralii]KXF79722.1 hypothetical protein ATN88_12405 [Enterovibrio coralii]
MLSNASRKLSGILVFIASVFFAFSVQAHGPSRLKVQETITIDAPAEKVWKTVGAFNSLSWLPPVTSVEMISGEPDQKGAERVVHVGDQSVTEALKKYDAAGMMLKYKIIKDNTALLPVTNYQSTLKVVADGDKSIVTWKAGFYRGYPNNDPPEDLNDKAAIEAITGLYQLGLRNLKALMEN